MHAVCVMHTNTQTNDNNDYEANPIDNFLVRIFNARCLQIYVLFTLNKKPKKEKLKPTQTGTYTKYSVLLFFHCCYCCCFTIIILNPLLHRFRRHRRRSSSSSSVCLFVFVCISSSLIFFSCFILISKRETLCDV